MCQADAIFSMFLYDVFPKINTSSKSDNMIYLTSAMAINLNGYIISVNNTRTHKLNNNCVFVYENRAVVLISHRYKGSYVCYITQCLNICGLP